MQLSHRRNKQGHEVNAVVSCPAVDPDVSTQLMAEQEEGQFLVELSIKK